MTTTDLHMCCMGDTSAGSEDCTCKCHLEARLANARQDAQRHVLISEQNADLFDVANTAVEEVRDLRQQWRDHIGAQHLLGELEAIVERFDAAIKDAIK